MNSKTVINNISKFWPGSTKCVRQSVLSNEHEKCVPVAAGGGGVQEGGGWCSKGFKVGFKKISIRSQDFSRPRKFLDKKLNLLKKIRGE